MSSHDVRDEDIHSVLYIRMQPTAAACNSPRFCNLRSVPVAGTVGSQEEYVSVSIAASHSFHAEGKLCFLGSLRHSRQPTATACREARGASLCEMVETLLPGQYVHPTPHSSSRVSDP